MLLLELVLYLCFYCYSDQELLSFDIPFKAFTTVAVDDPKQLSLNHILSSELLPLIAQDSSLATCSVTLLLSRFKCLSVKIF